MRTAELDTGAGGDVPGIFRHRMPVLGDDGRHGRKFNVATAGGEATSEVPGSKDKGKSKGKKL